MSFKIVALAPIDSAIAARKSGCLKSLNLRSPLLELGSHSWGTLEQGKDIVQSVASFVPICY
uniref:Uncharacterized protein n=1 Tax=Oscillatoriales cyanobacterium SpSt-402 TaxID=2282168 RepID=A0A832H3Y6_9CYAN